MHNNKFRVRSLPRVQLKKKKKKEIAMMIRHGAGKSEHEFGQFSKSNYSIDWTSSAHASRQNTNTATKADRIRREKMPNSYRQWEGCTDQALKHGDGSNMALGRQSQAIEVALANGAAQ